jgi:hypothetical protein
MARRSSYRRYPRSSWRRRKKKEVRKRMLRMRDKDLFVWDLNEIVKDIPDQSLAEIVSATVYSKASRLGIDEAIDYIEGMVADENLEADVAERMKELLLRNSVRR